MEPLQTPQGELKALAPFIQRGNELQKADPIMSYWCVFYAAQQGIASKPQEKDSKGLLMKVLDSLEARKSALGNEPAITDDSVGSAYVEKFALKVFVGADNEDRSGKVTRGTAKKFIAASNFLELLKLFGELKPEISEKIKYAKWKAADIAKAFREGRQPVPGPPGGLSEEEKANAAEAATAGLSADDALANLSLAPSKEEDEYVAREMAKLMDDAAPADADPGDGTAVATALSPGQSVTDSLPTGESGADFPSTPTGETPEEAGLDDEAKRQRRMSVARRRAQLSVSSSPSAASPNFSMPLRHPVSRESSSDQETSRASLAAEGGQDASSAPPPALPPSPGFAPPGAGAPATGSRPLPTPPQRDGLPVPPQRGSTFLTPANVGPASLQQAGLPPRATSAFLPGQTLPHQPGLPPTPSGLPPPSLQSPYTLPPFVSSRGTTPQAQSPNLPTTNLPSGLPPSPATSALPAMKNDIQKAASAATSAPGVPVNGAAPSAPSAPPIPPEVASASTPKGAAAASSALPSAPVAPPVAASAPAPPLAVDAANLPETLPPLLSAKVQKLAKYAVSALDYDDLNTARKQLREALDILEGRVTQ